MWNLSGSTEVEHYADSLKLVIKLHIVTKQNKMDRQAVGAAI